MDDIDWYRLEVGFASERDDARAELAQALEQLKASGGSWGPNVERHAELVQRVQAFNEFQPLVGLDDDA